MPLIYFNRLNLNSPEAHTVFVCGSGMFLFFLNASKPNHRQRHIQRRGALLDRTNICRFSSARLKLMTSREFADRENGIGLCTRGPERLDICLGKCCGWSAGLYIASVRVLKLRYGCPTLGETESRHRLFGLFVGRTKGNVWAQVKRPLLLLQHTSRGFSLHAIPPDLSLCSYAPRQPLSLLPLRVGGQIKFRWIWNIHLHSTDGHLNFIQLLLPHPLIVLVLFTHHAILLWVMLTISPPLLVIAKVRITRHRCRFLWPLKIFLSHFRWDICRMAGRVRSP